MCSVHEQMRNRPACSPIRRSASAEFGER